MLQRLFSAFMVMGLASAPVSAQTVIYVDANADSTPHDGSDWCHAYRELHEALTGAGPNTIIRVADGAYQPDTTGLGNPRDATFTLVNGVAIRGGYAGCGAPEPDQRDIASSETILSGDIGTANVTTDNCYHVVTASGVDASASLDGVTIADGSGENSPSQHWGAALYTFGASLTVVDCTIRDNIAERGAVLNQGGAPTFIRCLFVDNYASASGGAMYNIGPAVTPAASVIDCVFQSNSTYAQGGAVRNYDHSPTFTGCLFEGNGAGLSGAAVANGGDFGAPVFDRCVFRQNELNAIPYGWACYGGAMHNEQTTAPIVTSCVFDANTAIARPPSFSYGGAIANSDNAQLSLINCTLVDGYAMAAGGLYNENSATIAATSSILWNDGTEITNTGGSVTVTYSAVEGGWPGTGNTTANPMLAADLRPQPGSPCIDTGDPSYLPPPDVDLAGGPRVLCGRVDMGAYETGLGDYNCDQMVDLADFANWPACMTGPDAGPYLAGCECFDAVFDHDVDLADFAAFQGLFGP